MSYSPSDNDRGDRLMHHEYDGIREYDNPTPGWWHAIFIGSVVFSLFYWALFTLSPFGEHFGAHARHDRAVDRANAASFAALGELTSDGDTLLRIAAEPVGIAKGQAIFTAKCALCHGANGGGMTGLGLNLTDDFGKNIRTPEDVYDTVANGVDGTAMVPNLPILGEDDCILVSAYVISLRGTDTPGGLPPEGELMPAWEITAEAD